MKGICLGKKTVNSDFLFLNFHNITFPLKLEVSYPRKSVFVVNLHFLALWFIFSCFFTYSESPFNSLVDKALKCKNYSMGIGVMTV